MMRRILGVMVLVVLGLWAANTSLWAPRSDGPPRLIAHRGVHQTYAIPPPGRHTCTASPIFAADHTYIENTLPSINAAFAAGADVVEIDVHLTPDGVFAVFHDWTLECRTDGSGQTNKTPWTVLQTLDVGHGYSVDGTTFPLRGTGQGLMPRLEDVFSAAPQGAFLINFKSDRRSEGRALTDLITQNPDWQSQIWDVYGGDKPSQEAARNLDLRGFSRGTVKACFTRYLALGWSGHVPGPCRDTVVMLPINVAPFVWGWPHKFTARMREAGTDVVLVGPLNSATSTAGIDDAATLARVPAGFDGYVWTNRIEVVGPLLKAP